MKIAAYSLDGTCYSKNLLTTLVTGSLPPPVRPLTVVCFINENKNDINKKSKFNTTTIPQRRPQKVLNATKQHGF